MCGTVGPVILFAFLAWNEWQEAVHLLWFFVAVTALCGTLPGLVDGLLGAINGLGMRRHGGGCPMVLIPLLTLVLIGIWDRHNPKVGMTLLVGLVPVAFIWGGGFVGQAAALRCLTHRREQR
jgi:hypothetical protein